MCEKCPFCGEPAVCQISTRTLYRCATLGPDVNGEYSIGHTCDITTWTRLLAKMNAEIEEQAEKIELLKIAPTWLCSECRNQWIAAGAMKQVEIVSHDETSPVAPDRTVD